MEKTPIIGFPWRKDLTRVVHGEKIYHRRYFTITKVFFSEQKTYHSFSKVFHEEVFHGEKKLQLFFFIQNLSQISYGEKTFHRPSMERRHTTDIWEELPHDLYRYKTCYRSFGDLSLIYYSSSIYRRYIYHRSSMERRATKALYCE